MRGMPKTNDCWTPGSTSSSSPATSIPSASGASRGCANLDAADEAAQRVFLRLTAELAKGKSYPVPFRVVVGMVTEWTLHGFYPGAKSDGTLPENWDPEAPNAYAEWEHDYDLDRLFADLPPRQREVAELLYREGLSHDQIADRLGVKRNAVDQALHNAHKKLAEKLSG